MKRLPVLLTALFLMTLSASALDVVEKPISNGGYTHYAIDSGGTLWAWGGDFQGKLMGQDASQGAVPLMDHVVYAEVWDVDCCALKDDGTLWIWGGGTDAATGGPIREPYQVMDHVRAFRGEYAQLEDGTWVIQQYSVNGLDFEIVPIADNVAELRQNYAANALLMLGEDGNLYRAARTENWYDAPELLLEDVAAFSNNTAVTADGTLWAWSDDRPAILRDGVPDPADPYHRDLPHEELAVPVKITEGVRYAEASEDCTLAVMKDGSLWELPSAHHMSIHKDPERFLEVRTECRKLLDQAAPVQWFVGDPDAPAPVLLAAPEQEEERPMDPEPLLESEIQAPPQTETPAEPARPRREVPVWAALVSLLPVAAAVAWHLWKKD